jgi:uncharacterized surface protein with fasciclin (FAS1) repeats
MCLSVSVEISLVKIKQQIMKTKTLMIALVASTVIFSTACANNEKDKKQSKTSETTTEKTLEAEEVIQTPNIVGIAASNENFTTLVAAVKAAGLVETLSGDGPFTVFAPVNGAFDKLPEGTVASLLMPENIETLTAILTYHVVAGKFMAADVVKAIGANNGEFSIPTVQGAMLTATISDGNVILTDVKGNKSTIVITDVAASNGVIHAIDSVVMPK